MVCMVILLNIGLAILFVHILSWDIVHHHQVSRTWKRPTQTHTHRVAQSEESPNVDVLQVTGRVGEGTAASPPSVRRPAPGRLRRKPPVAASRTASVWGSLKAPPLTAGVSEKSEGLCKKENRTTVERDGSWKGERFQERAVERDLRKRVANPGRPHATWAPQSVSFCRNWFSSYNLSHCVCLHLPPTGRFMVYCRVNIFLSSSFVEELSVCDTCDYEQLQTVTLAFSSCSLWLPSWTKNPCIRDCCVQHCELFCYYWDVNAVVDIVLLLVWGLTKSNLERATKKMYQKIVSHCYFVCPCVLSFHTSAV